MSCDNIPHNGHVTSDGVIGLARLIDPIKDSEYGKYLQRLLARG